MKQIKTVRNLRRALGLTQEELARLLKVHQTLISAYERGQDMSFPVEKRVIDLAKKNDLVFEVEYE